MSTLMERSKSFSLMDRSKSFSLMDRSKSFSLMERSKSFSLMERVLYRRDDYFDYFVKGFPYYARRGQNFGFVCKRVPLICPQGPKFWNF